MLYALPLFAHHQPNWLYFQYTHAQARLTYPAEFENPDVKAREILSQTLRPSLPQPAATDYQKSSKGAGS